MRNDRGSGVGGRRVRRWMVTVTAVAATVAAVGACSGDDAGEPDGGNGGEVELPNGRDDVVLRLGAGPVPTLLIAGDGTVYELASEPPSRVAVPRAASGRHGFTDAGTASELRRLSAPADSRAHGFAAIAPAPTGPMPMTVRHLTDEGLQRVFERAAELGLLDRPPDYADVDVTDSGSTYLELRDVDGTYEHVAYALGYDDEEIDDERQALLDMVQDLGDIVHLAGRRNISDPEPYTPETYLVTVDGLVTAGGQRWPAGVPVEEGCVQLPLEQFPDPAAGTYRDDGDGSDGTTQRVWVVPDLPGDEC
jgi:hypothetical protein